MYNVCMSGLERVTVNLTPKAVKALASACEMTGDSKTDTINRALRLYAYVEQVKAEGKRLMVGEDGKLEVLEVLYFL